LIHRIIGVDGNANIAKWHGLRFTDTGENDPAAVELHGQHVIGVFERLAVGADDAILNARPHVAQVLVARRGRTAADRRHVVDGRLGLRRLSGAKIFDVDDTQRREFYGERGLAAVFRDCDLAAAAHHATDLERAVGRAAQGIALQADRAAAVVKAGLVDRDALVAQGFIHFDIALEA